MPLSCWPAAVQVRIVLSRKHTTRLRPRSRWLPIVEKPATQSTVIDNVDNANVRTEDVTLVSGAGLQNFSVVVGSFSLKANAEGLQSTLKAAGYDAQIVLNSARGMYRVVASTHADKAAAVQSRNQFRAGNYPDAWLLFKK